MTLNPDREYQRSKLERFTHAWLAQGDPPETAADLEARRREIRKLAHHLEDEGNLDLAASVLRIAADREDFHTRWALVRVLERQDRVEEAEAWLNDLIEEPGRLRASHRFTPLPGNDPKEISARQATRVLASLRERRGDIEGALLLLRRIAEQGDIHAHRDLGRMLQRHPLPTTPANAQSEDSPGG